MLERQHLQIIQAVAELGSLTRAAKALHLTQPALTHAIKKLEQRTATELWVKQGRSLMLTQAGREILSLAMRVIPQFDACEASIRQIARGLQGKLRIGMECHPCYQWLLPLVGPFLKAWPRVDVDVLQAFKFGGIGALFAHEIDILVTPDPLYKKGLQFLPVFSYQQVLVVASHHPLAAKPHIEPADLQEETLITYPVEASRLDIFAMFLQPAGVLPASHKTLETTDMLLQMITAGRGVGALPDWLVAQHAEHLPIKALRLGAQGINKQLYLGTRANETQPTYLKAFLEMALADKQK